MILACLMSVTTFVFSGCSATPYYIYERHITSRQASFKLKVPQDTTNEQMAEWGKDLASTNDKSPVVFITFYKGGEGVEHLEAQYSNTDGFTDLKPGP